MASASVRERDKFNKMMRDGLEFDLDAVIEWIVQNYAPDDIYSGGELEAWAKASGYVWVE